ncbi:MAG: VOC family protein, partial [Amphiplicatus sp.]
MANKHGDFIWYELMTADPGAAAKFYSDVVGWSVADSGQAGMDYRILQAPAEAGADEGAPIGGMLSLSAETRAGGAAPGWFGYVAVADTDAAAQRIAAAGGSVVRSPWDIPDVGRAAMVADGQGTPFYVMRLAGDFASLAFAHDRPRPGH